MKITESTVKETTASDAKECVHWDDTLKGFGLRVQPSGHKGFIVQYRTAGGRRGRVRKITIGSYGSPWTVDMARKEAKRILGLVGTGRDPAQDRRNEKEAPTVAELCDLYFAEGCATKKPLTVSFDKGRVERHIKPVLGRLKASEVCRGDIERFVREVAAGKTAVDVKTKKQGRARVTGGIGAATRALGLLSGIFTFAVQRKIRADNPVRGVKGFAGKKGQRFLAPDEWSRLGEAMRRAEADGLNKAALSIIRVLALTGARKSEISTLRWSEVDVENCCLALSDSKTGAKVVPIGTAALDIIRAQPRLEGSDWVFPGERQEGSFQGLDRVWRHVRFSAGLTTVRLHDLRHSYASRGLAAGAGLAIIGAILGHRDVKTTSRYAHLAADPVKRAADQIANDVSRAMLDTRLAG